MTTIGFVLSSEQFPVRELVDLAARAEEAGFDAIWSSDHFQPWQANEGHSSQAWVTLAAAGQRTRHVLMGTGVTCPSFRYRPAIVAEAFATLGILYPGRIFLGVGAGEALNEVAAGGGWGEYEERVDRLVEAVELIRQLWTGEEIQYRSKYYEIERARLYDVPEQPVPIYIAAGGPDSMHMAGKHGDGLITDGQRALDPGLREAFRRGAQEAGKNAETMPIVAEHLVVAGTTEEAKRGAELWRFMPKAWQEFVTDPDPVSIQRRAEQEVPLEQVYGNWAIGEDPQVHIDALRKLIDGGVTHIFVHSPQPDQAKVVDFYGRQVLPQVQHATVNSRR